MAADRRPVETKSWRQWTMRVAPPVVTAAALFAGWPSDLPAQSGWKWFGSQPPAAKPPTRPQSGFAATVQRLMEQARKEAAAGQFDAALKTAERAHKIADAAEGVLGRDPDFSPDVTRKFLSDMTALADASRSSSSNIAAAKQRPAMAPVARRTAASQSAPMTRPQTSPVSTAVAVAVPQSNPVISHPTSTSTTPPVATSAPTVEQIVPQQSNSAEVASATAATAEPVAPRIPQPDELPAYSVSMFTILGGDTSDLAKPAENRAPVPDVAALESLPEETAAAPALTRRAVTWSSRDAVVGNWYDNSTPTPETVVGTTAPVADFVQESGPISPEMGHTPPAQQVAQQESDTLTFGMTFSLGEPVTTEPAPQAAPPESKVAAAMPPAAHVAVQSQPTVAPATDLYDLSFAVVAPTETESASAAEQQSAPQSPYMVALDSEPFGMETTTPAAPDVASAPVQVTETSAKAQPTPVVTTTPASQPEAKTPVAPTVVEFEVDNALLITSTPVETTSPSPPATASEKNIGKKSPALIPAAAATSASDRGIGAIVPTEWSSANPEHRIPKRRAARWVDPTWESTIPQSAAPATNVPTESEGSPSAAVAPAEDTTIVTALGVDGEFPSIVRTTFVQTDQTMEPSKPHTGPSSQVEAIQAVRELKSALSERSRSTTSDVPHGPAGIVRSGTAGNVDLLLADATPDAATAASRAPVWGLLSQAALRKWLLGSGVALIGAGIFLFRSTAAEDKTV